ncbi:hypothetical protein PMI01_02573 [Caulobacter sp. AP07]|uniref:hypothetical protein n=1 Tax=Caulobacter sp. AP07 TaxID=1144304 RepID=UPI000272017B|nr:hypothetical protein [Caulobacter sp. AP07]EJL32366.1 hypothetical protein PMI01_02573 [Caulobacter sp. AP07]
MLARTPSCVECGLAWGRPGFACHGDDPSHGPSYWSDQGILCSVGCATNHFDKRRADGTFVPVPADCPVEF